MEDQIAVMDDYDEINLSTLNHSSIEAQETLSQINTEFNLGNALPIHLGRAGTREPVEKSYKTSFVDAEGNINHQTVTVNAKEGPLTGLTHEVLTAITTLAINGIKTGTITINNDGNLFVSFTITEICHLLGKKTNGGNRNNIVKAIYSLRNCDIAFKNFICRKEENRFKNTKLTTSIIKDIFTNDKGTTNATFTVEISSKIAMNLKEGLYISMDRSHYLEINDPAERRMYQILQIRRQLSGNEFVVDIKEFAEQFGVYHTKKQAYYVKKYLNRLKEKLPSLSFVIKQVNHKKSLVVTFKEVTLLTDNSFYSDLIEIYSKDTLNQLNLSVSKVDFLINTFPKEKYELVSEEETLDRAELVLDLMLYQHTTQGVEINYLDKYFEKLFNEKNLSILTGFKSLKQRIKIKKDNEGRKMIIEDRRRLEEEKRANSEKLFQEAGSLVETMRSKQPKLYSSTEEYVKNELKIRGIQEDELYPFVFEEELKKRAIHMMENGELTK